MTFPRLLAKSSRTPDTPREAETLVGHLLAVMGVALALADQWGERYLASLGLDPEIFLPRLLLALPRAAFAHDWAKANDHFQRLVRRDRSLPFQAIWHEQLSVWLPLHCEPLGSWLFTNCEAVVRQSVLAAVLGHHLRVADGADIGIRENTGASRLDVLTGHQDFATALRAGQDPLHLGPPPVLSDLSIDLLDPEPFVDVMHECIAQLHDWWCGATREEQRFVATLKALLVAADVAGSAVPRMPADPVAWSMEVLSHVCGPSDLEQVVATRLHGAVPRPFQGDVEHSAGRVTFVRAGCGSGKTAAAYLWAARRAGGRKLFFCYPTTGTTSQGFADYVPPDQFDAALIHSRATADLEDVLGTGSADAESRLDWLTRYAALGSWDAPITVCTVDTVLGLMQNYRTGLFSFPSIANGAFVFDEIHQYDDHLFSALLRFLDTFRGVPVLLMTASLPRARLAALEETFARMGEPLVIVEGPQDLERLKRYRAERAAVNRAWSCVSSTVSSGQRALWVANTVDRAVQVARQAEAKGFPVLPYHSRYRYQDRLHRHDAVIRAFGSAGCGVLAVTTQVCEVSLDLSADLLVTELAPIPALIQRLGRLNRRASPEGPVHAAPAVVLEPASPHPYTEDALADARRWLSALGPDPLSQADLACAFDGVLGGAADAHSFARSAWLDGGALTGRSPLREEGTTIPVIREEDVEELAGLAASRRERRLIRLTIPMPLGPVASAIGGWRQVGAVLVAPRGRMHYDERFGGHW